MRKLLTWTTTDYPTNGDQAEEGTNFTYASEIYRHHKFISAYSMKIPLKGSLPYIAGNEFFQAPSGSYFLANRGKEMECLPCQPGIEALFVNFSPALLADVSRNQADSQRHLLDHPGAVGDPVHFFEGIYRIPQAMQVFLQNFAIEMRAAEGDSSDLPPDDFFTLAALLLSGQAVVKRQVQSIAAANFSTRRELYHRVSAAHDFMLDQWNGSLTLEAVARHACLSPFHFHRIFKEVYGMSPMSFYKKTKLRMAKELLRGSQRTVTEVALQSGFADVHTFSKAFKREWGVNPSEVY